MLQLLTALLSDALIMEGMVLNCMMTDLDQPHSIFSLEYG